MFLKKLIILAFFLMLMTNLTVGFLSSLKKFFEHTCDKGNWCSGSPIGDCQEPKIHPITCCFSCPKNDSKQVVMEEESSTIKTTSKTNQVAFSNKILEINGSDPNNFFIVKTTIEIVPQECPKSVGFPGCFIKETCKINSDCKSNERCCLKDCARVCIRI